MKSSRKCIGDEAFAARVDELYRQRIEAHARPEDVAFRHCVEPLEPEVVLTVAARVFGVATNDFRRRRRNSVLRAVAARLLLHYAGLSQRETAQELDAGSGSAINKQISRNARTMESDPEVRARIATAATELDRLRAARSR